jgi:uncharacterized protein involved in exopolysaccharide biosynthesis
VTPPALPDQFQPFNQPEFTTPSKPKFRWHKFLGCLRKYWWLPLVTFILSCIVGGLDAWFMPPSFTSVASMWQTAKLLLPQGATFSEDSDTFLGTQSDILQGSKMHNAVLARLTEQGFKIPVGKDGQPLEVEIRLSQNPKSSVFVLQATGADADYTKAYLETLMGVYLNYKKDVRALVTGTALSSITELVQKTERDLKNEEEILTNFKRPSFNWRVNLPVNISSTSKPRCPICNFRTSCCRPPYKMLALPT